MFIIEQEKKNKEKLNHILAWLKEIGNKYGASHYHFRNEQNQGEAVGLPPKHFTKDPVYIENGEITPNNLRLYCHRLNDNIVVLLSGELKITNTAQECPNVRSHFILANQLSVSIDNAFKENEITWKYGNEDIKYSDNLILYF